MSGQNDLSVTSYQIQAFVQLLCNSLIN